MPCCHCHSLATTTTIPTAAPFCILCWGWHGGRVLCNVLVLQHGGGVLCAVLVSQEVGGGRALCFMLGWHHSGACVWQVGIMVVPACHVGMASQWGLHMVSQHRGWILRTVMGWWWQQTCIWQRWRQPGLHAVRQRWQWGLARLKW